MAYSVKAVSKNTFITFIAEAPDDGSAPSSLMASPRLPPRSRSAESARTRPEAEELQELPQQSLRRLMTVLSSGVLQPTFVVPRARSPAQTVCTEASLTSSPAPTSPAPTLKKSIGLSSQQKPWDDGLCSASNCSLSTVASDDASELASPSLKPVWSSGSISSMVSWADLREDEEMEFELKIEAGPAATHKQATAERPAPTHGKATLEMRHSLDVEPGSAAACEQATVEHTIGKVTREMSHSLVPKNQNMAEVYKSTKDEPPTTLMIRNIPGKYSQNDLMMDLTATGFGGTYDFLYMPIDKRTAYNVGYAFVNFIDSAVAAKCMQSFEGYCFTRHQKSSRKLARISVAHLQGLENNLQHYEKTAVNVSAEKQRRPVIFANISKMLA